MRTLKQMKKKIYLAGFVDNRLLLKVVGEWLISELKKRNIEIEITSTWIDNPEGYVEDRAEQDYSDIERSDLVLITWPGAFGTSSEMGYALGLGKPIIVYASEEVFLRDKEMVLPFGKARKMVHDFHFLVSTIEVVLSSKDKL